MIQYLVSGQSVIGNRGTTSHKQRFGFALLVIILRYHRLLLEICLNDNIYLQSQRRVFFEVFGEEWNSYHINL